MRALLRKREAFSMFQVEDPSPAFEIDLKSIIIDLAWVRLQEDHHVFLIGEVRLAQHKDLDAQQPDQRTLAELHIADLIGLEVDVLGIEEEKRISD